MDNLARLTQQIDKLVNRVQLLQDANRELMAKSIAADARAQKAEQKNEEMKQQFTEMLLNASITEMSGGTRAAKLRIKRLIKDIDRCIALSTK